MKPLSSRLDFLMLSIPLFFGKSLDVFGIPFAVFFIFFFRQRCQIQNKVISLDFWGTMLRLEQSNCILLYSEGTGIKLNFKFLPFLRLDFLKFSISQMVCFDQIFGSSRKFTKLKSRNLLMASYWLVAESKTDLQRSFDLLCMMIKGRWS